MRFNVRFYNRSGVTLIEVVLAAFLLSVFVAGYFWAFLGSKKVGHANDVKIQTVSVAGNVLELIREQVGSTDYYGSDFQDGTRSFQSLDPDEDVDFLGSVNLEIGHGLEPVSTEYTVQTYSVSDSGRLNPDGFKKISVALQYSDEPLEEEDGGG